MKTEFNIKKAQKILNSQIDPVKLRSMLKKD